MATLSAIRWLFLRSILAVLSTLIIVLPVPFHPQLARAEAPAGTASNVSAETEGFNFVEQSAGLAEAAHSDSTSNALKPRTAPVSASGTFAQSVSIDVPPGRAGMTPTLALTYSSDAFRKDSPVGAGWSFGVGSISRDVRGGFPPRHLVRARLRYHDEVTTFTSPSGRLMRIARNEGLTVTSGAWVYGPQRESSPVRYEYIQASDRWIEHLPSGVTRYYGSVDGRNARVVNELGTHEWLLLKERDSDGNTIQYDYHNLTGKLGQARPEKLTAQAVPVLKSVKWGANEPAAIAHIFRVDTTTRKYDGQLDMLNGHVVLTSELTRIRVYGPDPVGVGAGERLYWDYALEITPSGDTFRDLLRSVTRQGYDPASTAAPPPVQGSPVVHTFSYQGNGSASFFAGTSCNTATRAAYSSGPNGEAIDLAPANPEIYRAGYQLNLGMNPRLNEATVSQLNARPPMAVLSPEHRGAGYKFEDFDSDGDIDILYHPAGLGAPASRWLQHKSYLDNGPGLAFQAIQTTAAAATGSVKGISGNLLVSSFADVDGDTDPDAIAFPLYWSEPALTSQEPYEQPPLEPHFTAESALFNPSSIEDKAAVLRRAYSEPIGTSPYGGCTSVRVGESGNMTTLMSMASIGMGSFGWNPTQIGWSPPPVGTQDPEGNLPWGDPMTLPERIGMIVGGVCGSYVPWWLQARETNVSEGTLIFQIGVNTSRPGGATNKVYLDGWPTHVGKIARWGYDPRIVPRGCNTSDYCYWGYVENNINTTWNEVTRTIPLPGVPRLAWNAAFTQIADFHAPMADVNADGRADIVLLKSMQIQAGKELYTNFVPRVFMSNGVSFYPDRRKTGISLDITGLFGGFDWDVILSRRGYGSGVRRAIGGIYPGPTAYLAPELLDWLPLSFANEARAVLSAYSSASPDDEVATAAFRASLLDVFDQGVDERFPPPMASARGVVQQAMRNMGLDLAIDLFGFTLDALPNTPMDVTDLLLQANGRVYFSLEGLADTVAKAAAETGQAIGLENLDLFGNVVAAALDANLIASSLGPDPEGGAFTDSALEIFNDSRNAYCGDIDEKRTCDLMPAYPFSINFNSFLLDANGDGLPEMVAAHRPFPIHVKPTEEGEEERFYKSCGTGHEVHLNRGYRWEGMEEAHENVTLDDEHWSTVSTSRQIFEDYFGTPRGEALNLLNQRDRPCNSRVLNEIGAIGTPEGPSVFAGLPMSAASFSDLNADGLTDVIFAAVIGENGLPNSPRRLRQVVFLNTGRGFTTATTDTAPSVMIQNDGRIASTAPWCGIPGDFYMTQYMSQTGTTLGTQDRGRLVDLDNDGLLDVVYRGDCYNQLTQGVCGKAQWRRNLRKIPDLLTGVSTSGGAWTSVDYVAGTSDTSINQGTTRADALGNLPIGHQVVSEIRSGTGGTTTAWQSFGASDFQRIRLSYENFVREEGGGSSVGFEKVKAAFYNRVNGVEQPAVNSTTVYDVRPTVPGVTTLKHPLRGMVVSQTTTDSATNDTATTTTQYRAENFETGARVREENSLTNTRMDNLSIYSASSNRLFDSLGYPTVVVSGRSLNGTTVQDNHPETTITTRTFAHRTGEWRLGRTSSVTTVEGSAITRVLYRESTSYSSDTGRVLEKATLLDAGLSSCSIVPQQHVTRFALYNAAGSPTRIVDNGTRTVEVRYDPHTLSAARKWVVVPASGSSPGATLEEQNLFDLRFGAPRYSSDFNSAVRTTTYDSRGRVLSRTEPGNITRLTNVYTDPTGSAPASVLTTTFTDPGKSFTTRTFLDGAGHVLAAITQQAATSFIRTEHLRYDGFGRVIASYQPRTVAGNTAAEAKFESTDKALVTVYDGFDRVTLETRPDGRTQTHNPTVVSVGGVVQQRVNTKDARGNYTRRYYVGRGALIKVEHVGSTETATTPLATFTYARDGLGRILTVTDSDNSVRRLSYDPGGRLTTTTLAYRGSETLTNLYCYNVDSKLTSARTAGGRTLKVDRDLLGRVYYIKADFSHPGPLGLPVPEPTEATFGYDCDFDEGSLGKLCDRDDASGSYHYTYDDSGRMNGFELALPSAIATTLPAGIPSHYVGHSTYGWAGQLASVVYEGLGTAGPHRVDYTYDIRARRSTVTVDDPIAAPRKLVSATTFDEFSRLSSATLGNGVVESWAFDKPTGFVTSIGLAQGATKFAEARYPLANYDANGNAMREERYQGTTALKSLKTHSYDPLNRLLTSVLQMDATQRLNESFTYSPGGNLNTAGPLTYAYSDVANTQSVTGITGGGVTRALQYDDDGWLAKDTSTSATSTATRTLSFDAGGCLRRVDTSTQPQGGQATTTTTTNLCGVDGDRTYREVRNANNTVERTYYLPGGAELRPNQNLFIMKLGIAAATTAHLAWSLKGQGMVAAESGYVHNDARGSVLARTGIAAADPKTFDRQAEYDAWGNTFTFTGGTAPRYRFTGEEPDPTTGYYFFGKRVYDPTLRRWLSADPLVLAQPVVDEREGTQLNLYAYAANNPVHVTDRAGTLGDTGAAWEERVEKAMVTMATEHPREYAWTGVLAVSAGLAIVVLPEAAAGSLVGAALIAETVMDGVNVIVAAIDVAQNPSLQSVAGLSIATADLVSGLSLPAGDANTGRIVNQSRGGGGEKRGPKTDSGAPHNAKIRDEAARLKEQGNKIVAGGREKPEKLVPTPGGKKDGRRPDILYETPGGERKGRNVGKTEADGETPVKREREALEDLNEKAKLETDFVKYD